jgi:hypothetical protein
MMLHRMRITDKAIDEFVELYKEEFDEDIDRAEASEIAFRLMTLYEALLKT